MPKNIKRIQLLERSAQLTVKIVSKHRKAANLGKQITSFPWCEICSHKTYTEDINFFQIINYLYL